MRSKAAAGGRAAEFRIGSTLGALGRHAQGLLESALEGPRWVAGAGGFLRCPAGDGAAGAGRAGLGGRKARQLLRPGPPAFLLLPLVNCPVGPTCQCPPAACLSARRRSEAAGGGGGAEASSFADQLYIQGGRSAQEELEGLSSDSARWVGGRARQRPSRACFSAAD
jgi:hypothetical protein